jgi:hypothetical protein
MHVLEIMPYGSKKALLGHKGYIVPGSCWILVPRHFVFPSRYPFHLCRVEVIRASPGDTKVSTLLQITNRVTRGVAKICLGQEMKNSVREESANLLPDPAF